MVRRRSIGAIDNVILEYPLDLEVLVSLSGLKAFFKIKLSKTLSYSVWEK